jgi:hypothetical protein
MSAEMQREAEAAMKRRLHVVLRERVEELAMNLKAWERVFLRDRIEEHMGPLYLWPTHMAAKLLTDHLKYADRFTLTLFMLANKCQPAVYAEWLLKRGMLKDKSARDHVASVILAHKQGKLEAEGKTAYVMDASLANGEPAPNELKVWPVYTPNFAEDWQHGHYWDEAIHMLKNDTVAVFKPVAIPPHRAPAY